MTNLTHRRGALVLGVVSLLALVGCSVGTEDDDSRTEGGDDGPAADTSEQAGAADEEASEPQGALLLIMDASGSMNDDADGRPRIDAAKDALHDVVADLPDGLPTGLRVFGHRYPSTDRANGCRDTELIAPVEPLDREALDTAIDGYQARGFTPIGLALQEGGDDLPAEGPRTIVLVSDGDDTCGTPDPCEVARDLRAGGTEVVLHTVGVSLGDNQAARDQLSCVADAGGGGFYEVGDIGDLSGTLEEVTERETRRFETAGQALEGAPIPRDADTGSVDTAHVDTVIAEETNYYRFEIEPGSEVQAEVVLAPNPELADDNIRTCSASVALTDSATNQIGDFDNQLGRTTEAVVAQTPPIAVEADEVYMQVQADCSNYPEPEISYDIEFRLTVSE